MYHWYEDEKNIIELAEFLVESGEIVSTDELLDFFKYPRKYTEVWRIYQEEIMGKILINYKLSPHMKTSLPV